MESKISWVGSVMVVGLVVRSWLPRRVDRGISGKVAEEYRVADAGRFHKLILASPLIKSISGVQGDAYEAHRRMTVPYAMGGTGDRPLRGWGLVRVDRLPVYCEAIAKFSSPFQEAVRAFLAEYPSLRDARIKESHGLVTERDFPSVSELARRYSLRRVGPFDVPSGTLTGVVCQDLLDEAARTAVEAANTARQAGARKLLVTLREAAANLVKLSTEQDAQGKDLQVRDASISAVLEGCELEKDVNLFSDPLLSQIAEEVRGLISGISGVCVRHDPAVRELLATNAKEALARIEATATSILDPDADLDGAEVEL